MADEVEDGKFKGHPVAARLRFKPDPTIKADPVADVADEYIIVRSNESACGVIVYGLYRGKWEPNPFSNRPVVRWLLDCHQPIDSYACYRCGRRDGLDAFVPDEVWAQISPTDNEGGILCLWCIDQLCAEKGIACSASLHFAGRAITGTSQSDADSEHIRRACEERDAIELQRDTLLALLDGKITTELAIRFIQAREDGVDLGVSMPQAISSFFAELFALAIDAAPNFQTSMFSIKSGRYELTIRRIEGITPAEKLARLEELLAAYRAKRAVDGGGALERDEGSKTPSRPYDALKHYEADLLIEDLEARLREGGVGKDE
jgi:hypothetical protein